MAVPLDAPFDRQPEINEQRPIVKQELTSIQFSPADNEHIKDQLTGVEPMIEERTIKAMYRITEKRDSKVSLAPIQRVHCMEGGAVTELPGIEINLDDKLDRTFGRMNVGDETELSLTVKVVTGYRPRSS